MKILMSSTTQGGSVVEECREGFKCKFIVGKRCKVWSEPALRWRNRICTQKFYEKRKGDH